MAKDARPRAYTADEISAMFLAQVRVYVDYWEKQPDLSARQRLEGLAFSMLVMLDGGQPDLPSFKVIPFPSPGDRAFHKARGENWFPLASKGVDIAGALHDNLHQKGG